MDIARPDIVRKKRRRRIVAIVATLVIVAIASIGLSQLEPALPTVDSPVYSDTVKRGSMLREVRGNGTLVPEEILWIPATSPGRIERIFLLPGVTVKIDTVLAELSNPELEQAAFDAESQLQAAEAQTEKLKVQLESDRLTLEAAVASLKSDLALAKIEAETDEALLKDGLVPDLTAKRSSARAEELQSRYHIEQKRLSISAKSAEAQVKSQEAEVSKFRKQHELKIRQVEALRIRAGVDGTITLERLENALYVGRPVNGQADSLISLYKIVDAGKAAIRTRVKLGRTSVYSIEVDEGLQVGDQIILSDMAQWDSHERIRLR